MNGGQIQEFDSQLEKVRFGSQHQSLKDSLVNREGDEPSTGNVVMIGGDEAIVMLQPQLLLFPLPLQSALRRQRRRGGGRGSGGRGGNGGKVG